MADLPDLPDDVLNIDLNNLEVDCQNHPRFMRIAGRNLAEARKAVRDAKNALALICAEIRTQIRESPQQFGLEKLTVETVNDAMILTETYAQALEAFNQAEYEEDLCEQLVKALNSRDTQLTNEVRLHGQSYFSKIEVDPSTKEKYVEFQRRQAGIEAGKAAGEGVPVKRTKK